MPKDANTRLETVRYQTVTDPVYATVTNRPLSDLAVRDLDVDRYHRPSRGFRIRATTTPSGSVACDAGSVSVGSGQVVSGALTGLAIPPTAGAGFLRVDLIYLDLASVTGSILLASNFKRVPGLETDAHANFDSYYAALSLLNQLPVVPNAQALPLAYVNVDHLPTPFTDLDLTYPSPTAIYSGTPGGINDLRPSYYLAASTDTPTKVGRVGTQAAGTSKALSKADHIHELPSFLAGGSTPGVGGFGIGLFGVMHLKNTVTISDPGLTASIAASTDSHSAITVPANLFPTGLIVDFWSEYELEIPSGSQTHHVGVQIIMTNDPGGTPLIRVSGTTSLLTGILPIGIGLEGPSPTASAGLSGSSTSTTRRRFGVLHGRAMWVKASSNLAISGDAATIGGNWDPTKSTTIDFHLGTYEPSGGNHQEPMIGVRGLTIMGF